MARTLQERIDAIDAAMQRIEEGAQSYTERQKSVARGNYEKFAAQLEKLEARAGRASTSPFRLAKFSRAVGQA